ncbi:putative dihydrofolate synthetase [Yarrowia sp. B02]|nr:putative dihydrofolate synthetase [Yarrowia sp. B02]
MIDLGLSRISRLLKLLGNPQNRFKAVHVAGTNGKGSICAYISSVLTVSHIKTGRFTSPHLAYVWDCITIDGKAVEKSDFLTAQAKICEVARSGQLEPTEFEMLTATAFELFKEHRVEVAVVEVGLGGRLDATNVLCPENVLVSVISRVGMDHEGFLGSDLRAIAKEKAGIAKIGVPLILDGYNESDAKLGVRDVAEYVTEVTESGMDSYASDFGPLEPSLSPLKGTYQAENLAAAVDALEIVAQSYPQVQRDSVVAGISATKWPGRLELCVYKGREVLLDGAHNPQAAKLLGQYVDDNLRTEESQNHITFIVGFSQGKNVAEIVQEFLRPGDAVITTGFSAVEGMPWVKSETHEKIEQGVLEAAPDVEIVDAGGIQVALEKAVGREAPIVVCGSLYLVADYVRLEGR